MFKPLWELSAGHAFRPSRTSGSRSACWYILNENRCHGSTRRSIHETPAEIMHAPRLADRMTPHLTHRFPAGFSETLLDCVNDVYVRGCERAFLGSGFDEEIVCPEKDPATQTGAGILGMHMRSGDVMSQLRPHLDYGQVYSLSNSYFVPCHGVRSWISRPHSCNFVRRRS